MDQSVIETFKRRYRKRFIKNLVMEEDVSLLEYWKSYNIKNAVDNASDAWAEISENTLKKSWNKLWPEEEESVGETVDNTVYDEIVADSTVAFQLDEVEIGEWLLCDDSEACYELLTDEQIIEMATETELTDSETDTDAEFDGGDITDDETSKDARKDARSAAAGIEQFIDWYTQRDEANKTDTMMLRRLRSIAVLEAETTTKQTKISEFFKKN